MAWALLALAALAIGAMTANDARDYARFKALEASRDRQRTLLRWLSHALLLFLAMPLAGLALIGRLDYAVYGPRRRKPDAAMSVATLFDRARSW